MTNAANKKFCIQFTRKGAVFGDTVYAQNAAEALEVGKALYGNTCTVSGQLMATIHVHKDKEEVDKANSKFFDNDGNEISEEEWDIT